MRLLVFSMTGKGTQYGSRSGVKSFLALSRYMGSGMDNAVLHGTLIVNGLWARQSFFFWHSGFSGSECSFYKIVCSGFETIC